MLMYYAISSATHRTIVPWYGMLNWTLDIVKWDGLYYDLLSISYLIQTQNLKFYRQISMHVDVIKWKHFPHYWPFVWGIHWLPVNFLHKGQWRWALMFSLISTWTNVWVNNWDAGDLRHHHAHCDITVMGVVYHIIKIQLKNEGFHSI